MKIRDRFIDFWPLFISTHLHPWNRRFHAFGNLWMFGCFATFVGTANWKFLILGFLGYAPSWVGHLVFEKNIPVTFQGPYLSALSDLKMMGLMISGELEPELERLFGSPSPAPKTPIRVSPEEERAYQNELRYRIKASIASHPFRDYWDIFLLKHQNPINVWVHVLAMVYLYVLIAFAIFTHRWELLLAIPISQLAGLTSHALFERTHIDFEDALFSPRAFSCLNRMMVLVFTGGYWRELEKVQDRFKEYLKDQQASAQSSVSLGPSFLQRDRKPS